MVTKKVLTLWVTSASVALLVFATPAFSPKHPVQQAGSVDQHASFPAAEGASRQIRLGDETIIPVNTGGDSPTVMSFEMAVDVAPNIGDLAAEMEPHLRDAFVREVFLMSQNGAFLSDFTDDDVVEALRRQLTRTARDHLGEGVRDVLITDIRTQER